MKPVFFQSAAEFRAWLERHHAAAPALLVGLYHKESGHGMTYPQALDEALAFGWIDGVHKRLDAEAYTVRFTPRAPGSAWSAVNVRRVESLIAEGHMRPPGLHAFQERDEKLTERRAESRDSARFDPESEALLHANRKAASFFDAEPPGYRNLVMGWVMSAKKPETRARRLARVIELSEKARRLDPLRPNG
jgi:uncharacterized protein YdeI (YjbR/CyaY-like superfamily)